MTDAQTLAEAARQRALRAIALHVLGADNVPASYDDTHAALGQVLSFDEDMWMCELLDLVEATAAAEEDPDAWSDTTLPRLTQAEIDAQTDGLVAKALRDRDAPAAASSARGMRR
ncbi:hypothetical protein [Aureimonas sp. N4]|uniref:hypothetical protein n=1 Tax=Aureimonas sp. N4 TaxID=1638165 RepID=UPI000785760D|nr:hypothetical protein [Aureimonas sp. N4]